jgi:hypothetical protein
MFLRLYDRSRLHDKERRAFGISEEFLFVPLNRVSEIGDYFFDLFCIKQHRSDDDYGLGQG